MAWFLHLIQWFVAKHILPNSIEIRLFLFQLTGQQWYDHEAQIARKIIDQHSNEIFKRLLDVWNTWPISRQKHLAYILGESNLEAERALIESLAKSKHPDVRYSANEAMANFIKES